MTGSMNSRPSDSKLSARGEFISGVLEELPLQAGIIPFGMVYGILGMESGMTALQTFLLSSILFGGASQIIFTQLYAAATPFGIWVGSIAAINARHLLYSTSMLEYLGQLPLRWRILLAYLLTDEAYAVSIRRYSLRPHSEVMHYHLLGSGILLFIVWQLSTLAGIMVGAAIPDYLDLGFAIPLSFLAIVVPLLRSRPELVCAVVASVVALGGQSLPWNSWLIIAALSGVAAGMASLYWTGDSS